MGGVDNSGAGAGAREEKSKHQRLTVVNSECTMVYEGLPGEEALKEVTFKNGDKRRYWGGKGAERFHRIDKANGCVETYKGTTYGEYMTEALVPGTKTVLFGGAKDTRFKALEVDHRSRRVDIYKRDGEGTTTSLLLRKVEGGKFYARKGEDDEWEEVEVSEAWLEGRSELRKEEERKRAREEEEERERKRRREQQEREDRAIEEVRANADARMHDDFNPGGQGGVQGADMAPKGYASSLVTDPKGDLYARDW